MGSSLRVLGNPNNNYNYCCYGNDDIETYKNSGFKINTAFTMNNNNGDFLNKNGKTIGNVNTFLEQEDRIIRSTAGGKDLFQTILKDSNIEERNLGITLKNINSSAFSWPNNGKPRVTLNPWLNTTGNPNSLTTDTYHLMQSKTPIQISKDRAIDFVRITRGPSPYLYHAYP
jgi:hypothetical protein